MKENVKNLISTMENNGEEVISVSNLKLTLQGEPVTHAILIDRTPKDLALTSGDPSGKRTLYWYASTQEDSDNFDRIIDQINDNYY